MRVEVEDLPADRAPAPLTAFRARDARFIGLAASLFVTAMGANAFVQFVIPYLTVVRGWHTEVATLALIVGFAGMPAARLAYPVIASAIGDYGALLAGNGLYFIFLGLLVLGPAPFAAPAMGVTMCLASALVFMAGPVQVMDMAANGGAGRASGVFWASNFLAWLIVIPAYGALIQWRGLAIGPYAAAFVTCIGAIACAFFTPRTGIVRRRRMSWPDIRAQLSVSSVQLLVVLMFASSFSFGFMFGTFATYGTTVFGAAMMSFVAFGFYFARLPASIVAGWAADRVGTIPTLALTFGLATVAIATAAVHFEFLTLVVATVALGVIQGALPVVGMASITKGTRADSRPTAFAPIMGAAEFGVGLTLAVGLLLPNGNVNPGPFLGLIAVVYLMCLLLLLVWKPTTDATQAAAPSD